MTDTLSPLHSTVVGGLGTSTFTVVTAGLYTVSFTSSIPYIAAGSSSNSTVVTGGSGLQVVVNLNGTPTLTVSSPSPTQPSMGGSVQLVCAATDVITVVLSSSAAVDAARNAVKTIINVYLGQ